ncbi:hypothetical protein GC098_29115 [Paenibacillus sp. LMG 31458]|uniref:Uncharacterized protein n=1 Tax=Paenibacillus phytorum TaxID=2654977 RepID=A0ABX1Y3F8_9BACL|nr:hypothetical protein [Paenibacillus phytorum]
MMPIEAEVTIPGNDGSAAVTDATLNPVWLLGTNDRKVAVNLPLASVMVMAEMIVPSVQSVDNKTTIPAAGRPFFWTCPERVEDSPAIKMVGTAIMFMVIRAFFPDYESRNKIL